ncbi:hypothetical protein [Clostridium sp. UBA6640]|uniref:hypothetical protein n=1 Tax=Clostridium sp. UBA6640 TaxID=1946370 RepID=UPI0025C57138|nr:hypothetical protein [Clostridium sp. UBA6640]
MGWINEKQLEGSIISSWLLHRCDNTLASIIAMFNIIRYGIYMYLKCTFCRGEQCSPENPKLFLLLDVRQTVDI